MHAWPVLAFSAFLLAACGCSCPAPTVVVPQGSSIVCPNGSTATVTSSGSRC